MSIEESLLALAVHDTLASTAATVVQARRRASIRHARCGARRGQSGFAGCEVTGPFPARASVDVSDILGKKEMQYAITDAGTTCDGFFES